MLTSLRGGPWASAWADDPLGVLPAVDDAAGGDAAASEDADWRATREELRADLAAVLGAAAVAGAAQPNRESLGQLLLGFFGHWNRWIGGDEGGDGRNRIGAGKRGLDCSAERLVVCTRLGGPLAQKAKRWPANAVGEDFHLWPIEDPVDTSHDLGRIVTPRSLEVLRQELGAAVSKLDDGWALERVLEEHQAA